MGKKFRAILCAVVPAVVLALAVPASSSAAVETFLQLDGIQGESTAVGYENSIDVNSWSWSSSREAAKPPTVQSLEFTKGVDQASPVLFSRLTTGAVIPAAKLIVTRDAGNTPSGPAFMRLCMTGVRITGYDVRGEEEVDESVTLSFSTVVLAYQRQKADGSLGSLVSAGWNLVDKIQFGEPNSHTC